MNGMMAINQKYQGFMEAFNGKNRTDQGPISRVSPDASLANISGFSDKMNFPPQSFADGANLSLSHWEVDMGRSFFSRFRFGDSHLLALRFDPLHTRRNVQGIPKQTIPG